LYTGDTEWESTDTRKLTPQDLPTLRAQLTPQYTHAYDSLEDLFDIEPEFIREDKRPTIPLDQAEPVVDARETMNALTRSGSHLFFFVFLLLLLLFNRYIILQEREPLMISKKRMTNHMRNLKRPLAEKESAKQSQQVLRLSAQARGRRTQRWKKSLMSLTNRPMTPKWLMMQKRSNILHLSRPRSFVAGNRVYVAEIPQSNAPVRRF
jgi:hypothetical protein